MKNIKGYISLPWFMAYLILTCASLFPVSAQDTLSNGKALNFPFRKYGISIGNSLVFNGLRINFADNNVEKINGMNITFWLKMFKNQNAVINGISLGVIPTAGTMQPINVGILGVGSANQSNGLTLGGLIIGGDVNGLSISGLLTMADGPKGKMSGIGFSGIGIGAQNAINGLAVGGLIVGTDGNINGLTISSLYIGCKGVLSGVSLTPGYLQSNSVQGMSISGFSNSKKMHGFSFALVNKTEDLTGIQTGLINIARNNPKGLRILPFANIHLTKSNKN